MCSPNIGHVLLNDSPKFKYYASHAIWCIVNICTLSHVSLLRTKRTHTNTTAPPPQTKTSWTLLVGHIVRGHSKKKKHQRKNKWKQNRAHERFSSHSSANNKCQFSLRAAFHVRLSHPSIPTHTHTQTQNKNNGVKSDTIRENSIKFNFIQFNVQSRIRLTADRRPTHTHTHSSGYVIAISKNSKNRI